MPRQLLAALLDIERKLGRQRRQPKGPRLIDIDILLFAHSIVKTKGLTIPHPAMHERRFVLEPLAEIAQAARHPALKKPEGDRRKACPRGGQASQSEDREKLRPAASGYTRSWPERLTRLSCPCP